MSVSPSATNSQPGSGVRALEDHFRGFCIKPASRIIVTGYIFLLVGAARFELATPSPPDWCANQAAPRSVASSAVVWPRGADYRGTLRHGQRGIAFFGRDGIAGPSCHSRETGKPAARSAR